MASKVQNVHIDMDKLNPVWEVFNGGLTIEEIEIITVSLIRTNKKGLGAVIRGMAYHDRLPEDIIGALLMQMMEGEVH